MLEVQADNIFALTVLSTSKMFQKRHKCQIM